MELFPEIKKNKHCENFQKEGSISSKDLGFDYEQLFKYLSK